MSDWTTFDLQLTRSELGLSTLDLNDQVNYIVAETLFGGQQSWNRQTVKSPFVDGEFTVHRSMSQRQERVGIQVLGDTQTTLQTNLDALLTALSQFRFNLIWTADSVQRTYNCETADYQIDFSRERWMARKVLVTASVPVYPKVGTS